MRWLLLGWVMLGAASVGSGQTPTLVAAPTSLQFTVSAGVVPPGQQVALTSTPGAVPYEAFRTYASGAAANWLQVNPSGGASNSTVTVSVVNAGFLSAGTHTATIWFSGLEVPYLTAAVNVTLTVVEQGNGLGATPSALSFQATGPGLSPAAQSLTVTAPGTVTVAAATLSGGNWLAVNPIGGQGAALFLPYR